MSKCKLCRERGEQTNGKVKCAFEIGEFSQDNWNCATAIEIRGLIGEGGGYLSSGRRGDNFYLYRHDQSYGALWVPPHPEDVPNGDRMGLWRGGGMIVAYWYRHYCQTELLMRLDPLEPRSAGYPLTLAEAEAAIENIQLTQLFRELTPVALA